MALIDPNLGIKLLFILGIINVISILLVFFSCRCMVGIKFVSRMMKYDWYKKFYNKHCYYWWVFFTSVLLHAVLAVLIFGIPF